MRFGVITRVPDPTINAGNLAAPMLYQRHDSQMDAGTFSKIQMSALMNAGVPVFTLGEIIIMEYDEYGRELVGHGRKPSKWDVTTEMFSSIEAAVKRAREVSETA